MRRSGARWTTAFVAVLLAALVVGCGESTPKRTASDLAEIRAAAGLPTPTSPPPTPTAPPSPTPTVAPPAPTRTEEEAQVASALLTDDDLPTVWSDRDDDFRTFNLCDVATIADHFPVRAEVNESFSSSYGGALYESIYWMPDTDMQAVMEWVRTTYTCDTARDATQSGEPFTWTFNPGSTSTIGESSFSRNATITFDDVRYSPHHAAVYVVQRGEYVIVLVHLQIIGLGSLTAPNVDSIAYMATEKLERTVLALAP